ncbi:hypothetical protein C3L33_06670, partial [Rhododendron williamsianum]
MESLDISHNNLTGVIPKSLEALLQLKYFNVSFNRLTGEIPSGGPFDNLTNESFLSNEALCGAPRLNVPPCQSGSPRQSRKRRLLLLTYVSLPIASILFAMAITFSSKRCRRSSVNPAAIDTSPIQCVSGIMELALRCSAESPEERMNMKYVLAALKKIKLQYLTNCRQT